MARCRKTFEVNELKRRINTILAGSTASPDYRRGMMMALEEVLFLTDNYKGFAYLEQDRVPSGQLPGIVWGNDSTKSDHTFPDQTRVRYN